MRADVEARQRPDPVAPMRVAGRAIERKFQVRPGLDRLADIVAVARWVESIRYDLAVAVHEPNGAIIVLPRAVGCDQAHKEGREITEDTGLFLELLQQTFETTERIQCRRAHLGHAAADVIAAVGSERCAYAARHGPGWVDLAPTQELDHLLAELAQPNAVAGQLWLSREQAEYVARCRLALHAEQQVRRAEIEKAQRMGLDDLGQVDHPAQLLSG